ncbi:MAG: tyrosine phosphatase family protein [Rhizobium sp.]|nr:tyrosine phosphatase family protein [Rhizobium sp.]
MIKTRFRFRRILLLGLLLVSSPFVAGASYLGVQYLRGNVHEVDPGQLYRSGQLNASQIRDITKRYGIRSIVNLRGASPRAKWYQDELTEAKALGITHVDFKMSATHELPLERVAALEALLKGIPKPVLIHCEGGSDRTGLASAIFMHRIRGMDIEKAEGQISLYYGHFSVPRLSQAYPMDETWEKLEDLYRANEREARL